MNTFKAVGLSIVCVALLSGCGSTNVVRTQLDECADAKLDNIVYMRPDKSVLTVACTPRRRDIQNKVVIHHDPLSFLLPSLHKN